MYYLWFRQRIMFKVLCKLTPTHLTLLATPVEPFSHHLDCPLIKLCNTHIVFADSIVLEMASKFGCKNLPPLFSLDLVSYRPEPIIHFPAFCRELLATRLSPKLKIASAGRIAIMRKTQKLKRIGLTVLTSGIFFLKSF
jgi:hypothetical protein